MGIQVRAAIPEDAASMARVHVDSWRSTYAGIVPAEYLAGLSYRNRESLWKQLLTTDRLGTNCFVADTGGGDIVGFAMEDLSEKATGLTGASSTPSTYSKSASA